MNDQPFLAGGLENRNDDLSDRKAQPLLAGPFTSFPPGNVPAAGRIVPAPHLSGSNAVRFEQISCPFCGSPRAYEHRRSADIVRCACCSTVYLRTRLKQEQLEQIYQTYADEGSHMCLPKTLGEAKQSGLKRDYFLQEILEFTQAEGQLLDVGCGWGAFLLNAREHGFKPTGLELTRKAVAYANQHLRIPVVSTQFLDTPYELDSLQVVTMNHVLEHITKPRAALQKIYAILKPGGLFCGIVPNMDSFCARALQEQWYWLDPNYHYVHYTPSTLRTHLEAAGFQVERMYTATGDYGADCVQKAAVESHPELADESKFNLWLKDQEHSGHGEELRFFVRKPLVRPAKGCRSPEPRGHDIRPAADARHCLASVSNAAPSLLTANENASGQPQLGTKANGATPASLDDLLATGQSLARSGRIKEAFEFGVQALLLRPGDREILSFISNLNYVASSGATREKGDTSSASAAEFLWSPTRDELVTTKFMRNRILFSTLAQDLLPRLRKERNRPLRLLFWACSTGCEPYTLKFLLGPECNDEIVAIDHDAEAIRSAQRAVYYPDSWTVFGANQKLLTDEEIQQLFKTTKAEGGESFHIAERYRKNISFLTGDLFSSTPVVPWQSFDLVICNNLLLHLKDHSAGVAWDFLYKYVNDDGLLVIGGCKPSVRASSAKRLNLVPCDEKLAEISTNWCGVSGAWDFVPRPAWAFPQPKESEPDYPFLVGEIFRKVKPQNSSHDPLPKTLPKNVIISGTNFWNPGDDFVREGVIRILRNVFEESPLNLLFYNFNPDVFPHEKLFGGSNVISSGDLEKFRDSVDAVVIVGVSAGHEVKPLYRWILANNLAEKVFLISGHYESPYCVEHISQEPEATIFRKARLVIGRTKKFPDFLSSAGIPYHHVNCPALLSVPNVKAVAFDKTIQRVAFSIQLPRNLGGLINQSCAESTYELALSVLWDMARQYEVEVIAHHKTEYFHFLNVLRGTGIPVIFSSFYPDISAAYRRADLVVTTRLHASLLANGHGIPGIIINDTDRHTHTLEGFPHSPWVNTRESLEAALTKWRQADLSAVAREAERFKTKLLDTYVQLLRPLILEENRPGADLHGKARVQPASAPTRGPADAEAVRRILFVRTDSIGDMVLASSMLEPIRKKFPRAKIAVLCQHHVAQLLTACPFVDSIICYDRKQMHVPAQRDQIISEVASFEPDLILNSVRSRDNFSNELTLAFAGARHIAIDGDLDNISKAERDEAGRRYELLIPTPEGFKVELERHADFLRGLGIDTLPLQPVVWTSPDDEALADAFFKQLNLSPAQTIAVFPGAQHEIRVFSHYGEALKNLDGFHFMVFGDASQNALAEALEARFSGRTVNLCGRTTLRETAALLRRCRLYVGAESAGAHIACAVGLQNVVLLGGGHFGRFMPYSPLTSAVVLPLDCFGCNWRCRHSRAHCIKDVAPEVLARAIRQTLDQKSARPRVFLQTGYGARPASVLPPGRLSYWIDELNTEVVEIAPDDSKDNVCSEPDVEIVGQAVPEALVTVVISTYQSEKFIGACLENLSRQTIFGRCEVIVVDSGSPENERGIVLPYQERYPNIRYVRTERETLYAAWNRGLSLAHGRYWANLNTDDSLRNDALEILVAALEKHSDCVYAYADNAWTTKPNDTFPSTHIVKTVKYPDYAPIETLFYCITGCLQFFRTESLRELGGFDATLRCAGDYEATLKVTAAGLNAVHVPEVLSLFYQNTAGLTQASNRAAFEHDQVMTHYRDRVDAGHIFKTLPGDTSSTANALTAIGVRASHFNVPWESRAMEHNDFAFACLHKALEFDPDNQAAGMQLVLLNHKLHRLNSAEAELVSRWPNMPGWIRRVRAGEGVPPPVVQHAVLGPVFRPADWSHRPSTSELASEPRALRPWITRIEGRHVYLSADLFTRPAGFQFQPGELEKAAKRLVALLAELPPFYAHFGGAGDALLLLASFYDQHPDGVVFCHPNNIGAAKALFDAFPKLSKIYFLPQHAEPFFHIVLRYGVYQLKNCLGAGATPCDGYEEEWTTTLDIEKKYRINKSPRWAAAFRRNENSRRVAVAPKGSLSGMVGTKQNIISTQIWSDVLTHMIERGFEPVILGLPGEAQDYPALPGTIDARGETFSGQMTLIGQCAGVVGADSWAKSFSALAEIPTIVFEPIKGPDLCAWKDPSDWVFIEPWPAIELVNSLEEFRAAFDVNIAGIRPRLPRVQPVVAWEGSFLDHGSLSHINRELTSRLADKLALTAVGRDRQGSRITSKEASAFTGQLAAKAPADVMITVRHQWPPDWSRPVVGSLVVIQPWEYGALPKAWVEAARDVDEFWVPSPQVRSMYVQSGIGPEKVRVVPNGVDTAKFRPGLKPLRLKTRKKFKFLFVGGTIFRKGIDLLLAAFTETFTAQDDVCLVIKDFGGNSCYQGQTAEGAIRALQQKPNVPEIIYLNEELSPADMPSLYAACDCLVLPYRGEGFGLPVLEAMACALPVIVTAGGATDSFVSADAGWKVPSRGIRLGDRVGDLALVKEGWLLEPIKVQLAAVLKFAANHPEECRRRGACGRVTAEKRFDWKEIAAAAAHRLGELAKRHKRPVLVSSAAETIVHPLSIRPKPVSALVANHNLKAARQLLASKSYEAAWQKACELVSHRPFNPEAFLVLGEAALQAGNAKKAVQCGRVVLGLCPRWDEAKRFLKKATGATKTGKTSSTPALAAAELPQFEGAPRLTVCLIARNEEKFISRCLDSVRNLANQLVVVDTGSTDRTVEIAKSFGAEVHHFDWCDDFSAARNAALEHARGDWVLVLDADEELPADQHARLLADLKNAEAIALRLPLVNKAQEAEGCSFVPRLFRNAPGVYFYGRIHEQVFPSLVAFGKQWGLGTGMGSAQILHHGYAKETVKDRNKIERNLKLLRLAIEESPEDTNLNMNLGLELVRSGNLEEGLAHYRRAFECMTSKTPNDTPPELREALLTQFTSQLYKVRAHHEVVEVLTSPASTTGGLTASLHFALGLAYFELGRYGEAAEQMRQCLAKRDRRTLSPINTDILTSGPYHCLARTLARSGDLAGAEQAFLAGLKEKGREDEIKLDYAMFLREQNRPVDALNRLHELVTADPKNIKAWRLGAEIALSHQEFLEVACDWTAEAIKQFPKDSPVIAQRAEALMLRLQPAEALICWETAVERDPQPRSKAALLLCELIEDRILSHPEFYESEVGPIGRAFVDWYQRCLQMKAQEIVSRVNERLEALRTALPATAGLIEAAVSEAQVDSSAAAEPCLA